MTLTPLGVACLAILALCMIRWGYRRGVAYATAVTLPLYDSSAVIIGNFGVASYYVGVSLMVGAAALRAAQEPSKGKPSGPGLLLSFWAVAALTTILGPSMFAGMEVFSSDVGLDEQVGHLAALDYSTSNAAQIIYLTLNLCFVAAFRRHLGLAARFVQIALTSGVLLGLACVVAPSIGFEWPQEFFDNTTGNAFAYSIEVARPRAQFSEPSHLGSFASAALAWFATSALLGSARGWARLWAAAVAVASGVLVYVSATGTAIGGLAIGLALLSLIALSWAPRNPRIPPGVALLILVGFAVAVLATPTVWDFGIGILEAKQGGRSLSTRVYADSHAIEVLYVTLGFGVGVGSNRTSSLATLLMSTTGIVGFCLFLTIFLRGLRRTLGSISTSPIGAGLLVTVVGALVSYPSLSLPLLWALVAAALSATPDDQSEFGVPVESDALAGAGAVDSEVGAVDRAVHRAIQPAVVHVTITEEGLPDIPWVTKPNSDPSGMVPVPRATTPGTNVSARRGLMSALSASWAPCLRLKGSVRNFRTLD